MPAHARETSILFIEELSRDSELVQRHLHTCGLAFTSTRVASMEELEAALTHEKWDLVLADHNLPGTGVDDAISRVRKHLPDVPVILLADTLPDKDPAALLQQGVNDIVLRGELAHLGFAVTRCLSETAQQAENRETLRILQEKWRETEAQHSLKSEALSAAVNAVLITDTGGKIVWINPAFTKLTGYAAEECIGHSVNTLLKSDRQAPEVYRELWETLLGGQPWYGELYNRRKDGSIYLEEQSITPVRDARGRPSYFIAIKQDITERRKFEVTLRENRELLERYQNHLEDVIRSRTAELEEARQEAERLARVKSEFIANMSHEIRTPLNAVMGLTRSCLDTDLNREQRNYLENSQKSAKLLLGILNDILDFSKIEAGEMRLESIPFQLGEVFGNLETLFSSRARESGLALELNCPDEGNSSLLGDPLRLTQVLTNLVNNALKFTEAGRISVSAQAIRSASGSATYHFEVLDTGLGMTPEQQSRLFRPFTQADSSMTRRFGGTGLGLAISAKLVSFMGGSLAVESEAGKGSRFHFQLPFEVTDARPEAGSGNTDLREIMSRLSARRVLLVEDNETNRWVAGDLLAKAGLVVGMAEDGRQAVDMVTSGEWEAVLMDIQMPGMDGLAATRAIRARSDGPQPPIIAMTAHANAEEREQCGAAGMNDFVTKPVLPEQLFQALARNLEAGGLAPMPPAQAAPSPPEPPAWSGLDRAAGLAFSQGDRRHYYRLLAHFQGKEADILDRASAALASEMPDMARRLAHTLKSMAGTLGARRLASRAAALETALKAGETAGTLAQLLAHAQEEMDAVLQEIAGLLGAED